MKNRKTSHNLPEQRSIDILASRWNLSRAIGFVWLCFTLLLYACNVSGGEKSRLEKTKQGRTMETAKEEKQFAAAIPPIDAAATKETETATFALG